MPGTILENLSGRKLSVLVAVLLVCQLACFLVGLVSPKLASTQTILATVCVDEDGSFKSQDRFLTKSCKHKVDLTKPETVQGINGNDLVFVVHMPHFGFDFSRWQQNLIGVSHIEFIHVDGQKILGPTMELTLEAKLAYSNKQDPDWKYYAGSEVKRFVDCELPDGNVDNLEGYQYICSEIPLFELGSLHHDFYLLNLRLPYDETKNVNVGHIYDLYLHMICMSGGFTKVWVGMKMLFFPLLVGVVFWFWRRVQILNRTPALLEYMLLALGDTLIFLNLPLELLTLCFDMPYMLVLGDIRQGVFYAMLLSFWLVFAGEHMLVQDNGEKNTLKMYWKHLTTIVIGCVSLLAFDLCERGVQLVNPFYSIWVTPIGTNLALSFIVLAGLSASMYFIFLCYMIWKVFKNISVKRAVLPNMSAARRLHYEGIIYRFNFLMLATVICAAVTIISFILSQVDEGRMKWDENMDLDISPIMHTGVYGMWNVYICAMLMLYAPSHKQWPDETLCGDIGESVEFSRLPTDPSPNEISSLTSFASKASIE